MVKIFMVKATVDAFFNISISTAKKKVDAKTFNLDIENINVLGRNLIDIDIVPLSYQHLKHEMSGLYTLIMVESNRLEFNHMPVRGTTHLISRSSRPDTA